MVKAHFLFIISITSAFLLTIQLIALQYLIRQATIEEPTQWKILDAITSVSQQQNVPIFVVDQSVLQMIQNGTHLLEHVPRPVEEKPDRRKGKLSKLEQTRMDSDYYEVNTLASSNCRVFCSAKRKITYLATLADFVSPEAIAHLTSSLSEHHGLTVISLTDTDPTLLHLNLQVTIPTHLLIVDEAVDIRKESHVVHIAILHDRIRGKYWWQAPMKMNENQERILHRQGLKRTALRLPHSNAIFPKTEVLRTTIDGLNICLPLPADPFLASLDDTRFIECNLKRSSEFYSQYPKDDSLEAIQFRTKALALLTKVRHLLEDDLHIPFWLSSGTLLGYYRQCDFIVYSGDVDIGIWADDYRPEIIEVFSSNNLPLIHWFGRPNDSLELSFVSGDLKLDIFFFYRDQVYWNGGTQARTGLKFKYDFPKFRLCWTEFLGLLLKVPCETEEYIEANYGKDWAKPVKTWDWKASPPNVRPNGQWEAHEWAETIRLIPIPKF